MEKFNAEYRLIHAARPPKHPLLAQRTNTDLPWWRVHARSLWAALIIFVAITFFGWQIMRLFIPPSLIVVDPSEDVRTSNPQILISGQTAPGATASINNDAIEVNAQGQFRERIDLKPGLNTLQIAAKKDRSGERIVTRQILYEPVPTP